jgi:hypothetical protein
MRRGLIVLLAASLVVAPLRAQTSPIVDLMVRARAALNDLHYAEADSLAATVLVAFADRLNHDQRIEALGIRAASLYPDTAGGGVQHADSAIAYLALMVRTDPTMVRMRSDLSWTGLDSLFTVARARTFAFAATPLPEYELTGPDASGPVEVESTRPARVSLWLLPSGGAPVLMDTAAAAPHASLRLRGFVQLQPLAIGSYSIAVLARDTASQDSLVEHFTLVVAGQPLQLLPVPRSLDSSQLKREIAPPARARGIVAGLLLGGGAIAAATIKGSAPLSTASSDGRGYVIGVGLAAGALVGGLMDKGQRLPENVAANARLRAAFAQSVKQAHDENQRRIAAYHMTLTMQGDNP